MVFLLLPILQEYMQIFPLPMGGSGCLVEFYLPAHRRGVLHGYVGAGPYEFSGEPLKIGLMTEVGWAYQFKNVPLILAMDWRPAVQILSTMKLNVQGIGLNVRYPISSY